MLIFLTITIIVLILFILYIFNRQKSFNKEISKSIYDLIKSMETLSNETNAIANLSQALVEETISLSKQSDATRDVCLGLINNNKNITETVGLLIKSQDKTSEHIQRVVAAFNKKVQADKKFVQEISNYIEKDKSSLNIKDKKIFN